MTFSPSLRSSPLTRRSLPSAQLPLLARLSTGSPPVPHGSAALPPHQDTQRDRLAQDPARYGVPVPPPAPPARSGPRLTKPGGATGTRRPRPTRGCLPGLPPPAGLPGSRESRAPGPGTARGRSRLRAAPGTACPELPRAASRRGRPRPHSPPGAPLPPPQVSLAGPSPHFRLYPFRFRILPPLPLRDRRPQAEATANQRRPAPRGAPPPLGDAPPHVIWAA